MNLSINGTPQIAPISQTASPMKTSGEAQADFANNLKSAIENLNNVEKVSDAKTAGLASGEVDDLHEVMIAAQKASITLETTVQIQRKVIDAYNEIMRMQV